MDIVAILSVSVSVNTPLRLQNVIRWNPPLFNKIFFLKYCFYFPILISLWNVLFAQASCRATRGTLSGYFLAGRSMMWFTVSRSTNIFLYIFVGHMSIFVATHTSVLNFWWHLWVSKPEWAALFTLGRGICDINSWDSPLLWHLCQCIWPAEQPATSPRVCFSRGRMPDS